MWGLVRLRHFVDRTLSARTATIIEGRGSAAKFKKMTLSDSQYVGLG